VYFSAALAAGAAAPKPLVWDTPLLEPNHNRAGKTIIGGGMPIGNGETAALVFPVVKPFMVHAGTPAFGMSTDGGASAIQKYSLELSRISEFTKTVFISNFLT
jgi:hypothetical protein